MPLVRKYSRRPLPPPAALHAISGRSKGESEGICHLLDRYANSKYWVDFEDFAFYRMDVVDVYYVGGFGVMGWISASDYDGAKPDPLADNAAEIIRHMNDDHRDALVLLARVFCGVESQEATMTSVDRLGLNVRLKIQDGVRGAHIAFLREVTSPAETRAVLLEMVQQARQK
jgi:heme iron utilization protein